MDLYIFDIDGTITNTVDIDDNCFQQTFEELYGINRNQINWDLLKQEASGTDSGLFSSLYRQLFNKEISESELRKTKIYFLKLLDNNLKKIDENKIEIPGATNLINKLLENNFAVSIATGCWYESAIFKLQLIDFDTNKVPLSHSDISNERPEILLNAIEKSKILYKKTNFDKITYIGDGFWDYLSCKKIGINFIGLDYNNKRNLENVNGYKVFNSFSEIEKFILNNSREIV
ncbi:MAG TPA: HAD hydrolase-like protein [Candidatus Kapabacteria bacterium]|nr:HAD hydrolase-like protein [Candidatus Kapabacteria bacterium]HPO63650.1 HAD hydrolase-like protein [Candidatus Kapabacteria bacterium]